MFGWEIDNYVRENLNEKFDTPLTIIADDSWESNEDEPTIAMTSSPPKTTLTPPM